jgi:hypothetical protein
MVGCRAAGGLRAAGGGWLRSSAAQRQRIQGQLEGQLAVQRIPTAVRTRRIDIAHILPRLCTLLPFLLPALPLSDLPAQQPSAALRCGH